MRGNGANDRQVFVGRFPQIVVALELFPHIANGIQCAAFVEFIDGDDIGKIQHVNFFQLRRSAKFRCHEVQGHVAVVHDLGVALANAARLQDDEVELARLQHFHRFGYVLGQRQIGLSGRQ